MEWCAVLFASDQNCAKEWEITVWNWMLWYVQHATRVPFSSAISFIYWHEKCRCVCTWTSLAFFSLAHSILLCLWHSRVFYWASEEHISEIWRFRWRWQRSIIERKKKTEWSCCGISSSLGSWAIEYWALSSNCYSHFISEKHRTFIMNLWDKTLFPYDSISTNEINE